MLVPVLCTWLVRLPLYHRLSEEDQGLVIDSIRAFDAG